MTSPTEPTSVEPSTSITPKKLVDIVDKGVKDNHMPGWARILVGLLAVLGAAIPVITVTGVSISQLTGYVGEPTKSPSPAPTPTPQPEQGYRVTDAQMIDYEESKRHAAETARTDKLIYDSRDIGTLRVKFFISDRCLQVIRTSAGEHPQTSSHYILASRMEERAPGKVAQTGLFKDSIVDSELLTNQFEPASLKPAVEPSPAPAGNCWNPHGGPFNWWNGEQRGCWLQVWRRWPDGCQHYQWFNTCTGYWDSLPNGSPQVYWTNCVH